MHGAHGRWGEVGVVLDGDGLLHVVLADVLVHLLHRERLPVLETSADSFRHAQPTGPLPSGVRHYVLRRIRTARVGESGSICRK